MKQYLSQCSSRWKLTSRMMPIRMIPTQSFPLMRNRYNLVHFVIIFLSFPKTALLFAHMGYLFSKIRYVRLVSKCIFGNKNIWAAFLAIVVFLVPLKLNCVFPENPSKLSLNGFLLLGESFLNNPFLSEMFS